MTLFFLIPENSFLSPCSTARYFALFSKYWFRFPTFVSAVMTELIIPENSFLSPCSTGRYSILFSKYWFRFPTFVSAVMTELIMAVK
jgi:hypothetical protein